MKNSLSCPSQYSIVKELGKTFFGHAGISLIVARHSHPYTITPAGAEASGKCYLVFKMMIRYCLFQQLDDILRAFEVAR